MKNTYISIIVLVILVAGGMLILGKGKNVEAPAGDRNVPVTTMPTSLPPTTTPAPTTSTSNTSPVKEFTVSGNNFSYTPSLITVKKGDRVKITFNNTSGFHDFVIDEYGVATPQTKSPTTEVLEFTADKVGSFQYYCSVGTHRAMGMFGTLKVE
ncbi:MAG: plastocyanin/azurin family copper-binding protein [Patescibacteria group bacterium]